MPRSKKSDTNDHLANALAGIDADIRALQTKRAQLVAIMGGESTPVAKPKAKATKKATGGGKKKRTMTDEAKQKISAAQKARWEAAKKKK